MTVEEAVSCLRGGAPPASAEGSAGSGRPRLPHLGRAESADVLSGLSAALSSSAPQAREFCRAGGPGLLLSRVPPDALTAAMNVVVPMCGAVAGGWGVAWAREWAAAGGGTEGPAPPAPPAPGEHEFTFSCAAQREVVAGLAEMSARHMVPTLGALLDPVASGLLGPAANGKLDPASAKLDAASGKLDSAAGGPAALVAQASAAPPTPAALGALVNAATAGIVACAACTREALSAQSAALLSAGARASRGQPPGRGLLAGLRLGLPRGLGGAVGGWARALAAVLRRPPQPRGDHSLAAAALSAASVALRALPFEAFVRALLEGGLLAAAAGAAAAEEEPRGAPPPRAHPALAQGGGAPGARPPPAGVPGQPSGAGDTRRLASGLLCAALGVLRDAHPRGHAESGRAKLRAALAALHGPLVAGLAAALPLTPAAAEAWGGAQAAPEEGGGAPSPDAELPAPDWSDGRAPAATALLTAALLVDRDAGLWLAGAPGALPALFVTAGAPGAGTQAIACEALSQLASDEPGRGALTGAAAACRSAAPAATAARMDPLALLGRLADR